MYKSPIEVLTKQMQFKIENDVFKAVQQYGITVDKNELIKALQYDRGQYEKGVADGMLVSKSEWISVEERLPEPYIDVITYDTVEFFEANYLTKDGVWAKGVLVSHWLPLPEPPKMKGGAE